MVRHLSEMLYKNQNIFLLLCQLIPNLLPPNIGRFGQWTNWACLKGDVRESPSSNLIITVVLLQTNRTVIEKIWNIRCEVFLFSIRTLTLNFSTASVNFVSSSLYQIWREIDSRAIGTVAIQNWKQGRFGHNNYQDINNPFYTKSTKTT